MSARAAGLALLLLMLSAAAADAAGAASAPVQLLPLPQIMPRPAPAPLPPPTSSPAPSAPSGGISPLLLEPAPVWEFPSNNQPPSLSSPPAPIDQQKVSSYRMWLEGQERLIERSGSRDELLGREIRQQLLQLEQTGGSR